VQAGGNSGNARGSRALWHKKLTITLARKEPALYALRPGGSPVLPLVFSDPAIVVSVRWQTSLSAAQERISGV
jgi:hypothetical protein